MLDDDQYIQPFEQHRLDYEEVTGDDRLGLSGQELPPGRPGRGAGSIPAVCRIFHTVEAAIV
ncbi:hypothetical protein ACIBI9_52880 [Nonomuraea sp. NPDC050451]|uniref:hypothetical protein n=1 Tax=Nonomuraea sp. NPDC050451 TaxID=3364364 RepID=UPI003799C680